MENQMIDIEGTRVTDLTGPLRCWDVVSMNTQVLSWEGRKKKELLILNQFKKIFSWNDSLEEILRNDYEALILTDSLTKIKWVNEGFTKMTGYHRRDVLGQSPKMLQGENTTTQSQKRVRNRLNTGDAFSETLINYRKNGEEYICDVDIHPIYDHNDRLCHYLALENEVS